MSPAELRALMAAAERQPGETTEQLRARASAEGTLSSWRAWLPALLITPSARWRFMGEPDPHGDRYNCERADLIGGQMTDDAVANAAYLDPTLTNLTIAKDRIRWLSRRLAVLEANPIATASQAGTRAPAAICSLPAGAHSSAEIPLNAVLHVAGNGRVLRMNDAEEVIAALERDRGANERDDAVRLIRFLAAACAETERTAA